ncbi:hypothetical protein [Desulfosporosinus lacus]|uniref:hypothetical protein n=1 Tax=Desulfosporosinus lacus TaxID=329936 RepID=UPI001A9A60D2|nr:hypothetical protein [Desulfosporosinus lacus]
MPCKLYYIANFGHENIFPNQPLRLRDYVIQIPMAALVAVMIMLILPTKALKRTNLNDSESIEN